MSLTAERTKPTKTQSLAHPLLKGNLEGIEQALALLNCLTEKQYTHIEKPYVESSIGAHLRHINDLYFALMVREQRQGLVDYDHRRRGANVETCLSTGIEELNQIKTWLLNLTESELLSTVKIQSETSIYQQVVCQMDSSLQRELLFVASHAIHHFAVMRVTAIACGIETEHIFSYAPATASYLRSLG